jgi:transcription-repair coupling factor (superfamily II helicase)
LAIAEAAQTWSGRGVISHADSQQATRLEEEIRFFCDDKLPIFHFPDWETLPYDQLSPHQDITSERLRILANFAYAQQRFSDYTD